MKWYNELRRSLILIAPAFMPGNKTKPYNPLHAVPLKKEQAYYAAGSRMLKRKAKTGSNKLLNINSE
jgi:hypothetical protein